jgi:histone acetyltransferase (RNA polymerase elongator complex component)
MQAENNAAGKPVKKIQFTFMGYTFMGYDSEVLQSFPFGFEQEFPAFLTLHAGVNLSIIDLM